MPTCAPRSVLGVPLSPRMCVPVDKVCRGALPPLGSVLMAERTPSLGPGLWDGVG